MTKYELIKQKRKETKERRKSQDCKVFEIKLDYSHLSKKKLKYLNRLFLEAKWLYNYQLSQEDMFNLDYKLKELTVLNKEKLVEQRPITSLSSQMKQALIERTKQNIINLSKSKKKNNSVGRIKYKSQINSIPLNQYNHTYKIEESNKYIKLQGFKGHFKVLGLSQIPKEAELANATLVRKLNNYYLHIVTFTPKQSRVKTNKQIGLDFGIKDNITDSEGNKYNFNFPEPKQLKKVSKKLNRAKKGSNNRYKLKNKLNTQYNKLTNRKKDIKNKFIRSLVENYDIVAIQDESVSAWKSSKRKGWGRRIQYSIMGGITSGLKKKPETRVVDKYFPSTQICSNCNSKKTVSLNERLYICGNCFTIIDRDQNAAINILSQAVKEPLNNLLPTEHRKKMPVEEIEDLKSFKDRELSPLKQEASIH